VDDASAEYPIFLTTGRVVSQFLSGTQTRRIGPLVRQYPEPRLELHPRLAARLGIADGDWATASTRRGDITLKAQVVTTIRPDTIFIPYHWPGRKAANQLTVAAQDPISKIPQYKVCGCRVRKADGPPDYAATLEPQQ
jgi:assimilatory nitrate reductase catalytic subunit